MSLITKSLSVSGVIIAFSGTDDYKNIEKRSVRKKSKYNIIKPFCTEKLGGGRVLLIYLILPTAEIITGTFRTFPEWFPKSGALARMRTEES